MDTTEKLVMSRKETPRPGILRARIAGHITNRQAAGALGVTIRHVQRLSHRYRAGGLAAVVHRGRGRPSPRRLPAALQTAIVALMQTTYAGFNDVHLTEQLRERHGLAVCRETVRRLRLGAGRAAVRPRRAPQYRRRRPPEAAAGSLLQLDGSAFAWFGPRGPHAVLVGAIDDATGAIVALHFRPTEDLHGYATLLHAVCTRHGVPLAVYGDRLNVFARNDRHWSLGEELQGRQEPTHLGRMLCELGIHYIAAHSPQAKGRIERLWGTLQDRLTSELRLHAIGTLEAGNRFLAGFIADFNRRFARRARDPRPVWRRPPRDLADVLSCRYTRVIARDNVVQLGLRAVSIPPGPGGRSYASCRVEVRECLDGRLQVWYAGRRLAEQPAPPAFELRPRRGPSGDRRRPRGPRDASLPPTAPPRARLSPEARRAARTGPQHPWRQSARLDDVRKAARARGHDIFTSQYPRLFH
jgi:transposase